MITIAQSKSTLDLKRLPLITNYPSFRRWNRKALTQKVQDQPMCIYLHIPFCTQRCSFCYYKTVDLKEYRPEVERYIEVLCKEIDMATEKFHLGDRPIHAVYFGGGTPSLLVESQVTKIVEALRRNFKHFDAKNQFSFEAEPLTISRSKLETLKNLGVTRLSMGMQSFVDEIIKLSGRGHDEKQAYRAIELAQEVGAGQWNINIDLLSGLAGETDETWHQSVERAIHTGVESITVYKMEAFANTEVFDQGVRKEELELPSEEKEMQFAEHAMNLLMDANYLPWSFFTYTKNGCDESQYITSIWRGMDFYGFGVSAFGSLGDSLLQNTADMEKYASTLEGNELPLSRGYRFNTVDQMVREVLMGAKLLSLDLKAFKERHGCKLETICAHTLRELQQEGLITVSADSLDLTRKGMLYGDFVSQTLADAIQNFFA